MQQLMKHVFTSLLLLVVWGAGSAYAQSPAVMRFNIPFTFNVGDKTFPPGQYSIAQPMQQFLVLRNERGQTIASTLTQGIESWTVPEISKLRFRSVDGQNVLSEVWRQDDSLGHRLRPVEANRAYTGKRRSPQAAETAEGSQP
jgi:hypothetical protein